MAFYIVSFISVCMGKRIHKVFDTVFLKVQLQTGKKEEEDLTTAEKSHPNILLTSKFCPKSGRQFTYLS